MGKPYDPSIRTSEVGQSLYMAWRRLRRYPHCEEWENYSDFYYWAMENGYTLGSWLLRTDNLEPYSPDNCLWYFPGTYMKVEDAPAWIDSWNKAVNRIRKYYKMPPLEGTDYDDL